MTLLLARGDLETVLEPATCLDVLRDGFSVADGVPIAGQRVRTDLPFPGTATALIPGLLPGVPAYTVKVNAKFPGARPALRGVICLHSGTDGELLALMDSATVTAWRTGLAAALGTHLLAGRGEVVGVIGAGAQAELMVRGLGALRPRSALVVQDASADRAAGFAARHGGRVLSSAAEVAGAADIVLTATWSREPLLHLKDTRPGQHFTSLGVDEPGKAELAADLLEAALLVVDDRELTAGVGVLRRPDATLGEIVRSEHPGRTTDGDRTVYAPVGMPWQDLALAWAAYGRAEREGIGRRVDLLA
ncbi:ornithine cyclodeaminase/alanine dehydrogenase-like protein (mu-crystallin family) [Streptomyces sp. SAI-208]|uniref:ornithine cyclodeaminase family protein n=1 Tax=Streptomyces sp. SAI-208 TaxID=2940550 RepID=UPI002475CAF0|nr:NAD(P)-binding domain-containing protein [Streptomyces sp. SAI-208]MDH6606088.1 ornithine cyclodeaminase/alanine dehydrogenase-like protein (mu-crystallin family) [Streptomyces sp. SAI-208]